MDIFDEGIENTFEPLGAFKNIYNEKHSKNVDDYFNALVEKSKIDIESNRELNVKIANLTSENNLLAKKIRKKERARVRLKILMIFLCILIIGLFFLPLFLSSLKKSKLKIQELKEEKNKSDTKLNGLIKEAYEQMEPLNSLMTFGTSAELFNKTVPFISMDKSFDRKRLAYLTDKFGFNEPNNVNKSALYIQSGEINGNPFFISNDLIHTMGTARYTNQITIHWTTTRVVNGKTVTDRHSQVLVAEIIKPCPYYQESTRLVYGNEAAPDLCFTRRDSDAEKLTDKQLEKKVDKEIKKLNKLSEKSIAKGSNYTVMGNSEFEVLFKALDRNNEVQFRLLFSPLAQKQLLALMKDKTIGYGDDFDFIKNKMINKVYSQHLNRFKLDVTPSHFYDKSFDEAKKRFIDYNNSYFRNIYFALSPVMAIPLYQMHKPHEFIYKDSYDSNLSPYHHEYIANCMSSGASQFIHPLSGTRNILKTSVLKKYDSTDCVSVTAYGYQTVKRVEYVTRFGGDGRSHSIAVNWTEYIPVEKNTVVNIDCVKEDKEMSPAEAVKNWLVKLKDRQLSQQEIYQMGNIVAYLFKQ